MTYLVKLLRRLSGRGYKNSLRPNIQPAMDLSDPFENTAVLPLSYPKPVRRKNRNNIALPVTDNKSPEPEKTNAFHKFGTGMLPAEAINEKANYGSDKVKNNLTNPTDPEVIYRSTALTMTPEKNSDGSSRYLHAEEDVTVKNRRNDPYNLDLKQTNNTQVSVNTGKNPFIDDNRRSMTIGQGRMFAKLTKKMTREFANTAVPESLQQAGASAFDETQQIKIKESIRQTIVPARSAKSMLSPPPHVRKKDKQQNSSIPRLVIGRLQVDVVPVSGNATTTKPKPLRQVKKVNHKNSKTNRNKVKIGFGVGQM